jgi:hypothetical protein
MNLRLANIALASALFALPSLAQAPAGAPANATGQCKDGTYWTGTSRSGACRGHKGIQAWYAGASSNPNTPPAKPSPAATTTTPTPAAAPAPAPRAKRTPPQPQANAAPGGGPGLVWVNTSSKVYHCYGDRYYGKTKEGKYMSESDAKTFGAHGDRGQTCSSK